MTGVHKLNNIFFIVNFPVICNNIPAEPTYGVYLSVDTTFQTLCIL